MKHLKLIFIIITIILVILIIVYNNRRKLNFKPNFPSFNFSKSTTNNPDSPDIIKPSKPNIVLPPLLPDPSKPKGARHSKIREMVGNTADLIDGYRQSNCKDSLGEYICRTTLQTIFGLPFNKCRPRFLKNPESKRNLELDGYNEDLKLAFEYQGIQHRVYPNKFHKTENEHEEQLRRDIFKKQKCEKYSIHLLVIYDEEIVPYHQIPEHIAESIPISFDKDRKDLVYLD